MHDDNIEELLKNLKSAVKTKDWDLVLDAIDYLKEFVEDDTEDDEL